MSSVAATAGEVRSRIDGLQAQLAASRVRCSSLRKQLAAAQGDEEKTAVAVRLADAKEAHDALRGQLGEARSCSLSAEIVGQGDRIVGEMNAMESRSVARLDAMESRLRVGVSPSILSTGPVTGDVPAGPVAAQRKKWQEACAVRWPKVLNWAGCLRPFIKQMEATIGEEMHRRHGEDAVAKMEEAKGLGVLISWPRGDHSDTKVMLTHKDQHLPPLLKKRLWEWLTTPDSPESGPDLSDLLGPAGPGGPSAVAVANAAPSAGEASRVGASAAAVPSAVAVAPVVGAKAVRRPSVGPAVLASKRQKKSAATASKQQETTRGAVVSKSGPVLDSTVDGSRRVSKDASLYSPGETPGLSSTGSGSIPVGTQSLPPTCAAATQRANAGVGVGNVSPFLQQVEEGDTESHCTDGDTDVAELKDNQALAMEWINADERAAGRGVDAVKEMRRRDEERDDVEAPVPLRDVLRGFGLQWALRHPFAIEEEAEPMAEVRRLEDATTEPPSST